MLSKNTELKIIFIQNTKRLNRKISMQNYEKHVLKPFSQALKSKNKFVLIEACKELGNLVSSLI